MSGRSVVGIDPSLTSSGIAIIRDHQPPELHNVRSVGHRGDSYLTRHVRIKRLAQQVASFVKPIDELAIIEGPALRSTDPGVWDRGGLWWHIYDALHQLGVPVAVCPPKVRCKWATDNGNADKAAVRVGVGELWPGTVIRNSDQADALVFATMAAQMVGMDVPSRPHHALCLTKVAVEISD